MEVIHISNKVTVKVDKIRSYQTLVYKNGNRTFKTSEYNAYERMIGFQINKLKDIRTKDQIKVKLHFKCKNRVVGDLDNITKPILDILQRHQKIYDDRYIVELHLSKTFGHKENEIEIEIGG